MPNRKRRPKQLRPGNKDGRPVGIRKETMQREAAAFALMYVFKIRDAVDIDLARLANRLASNRVDAWLDIVVNQDKLAAAFGITRAKLNRELNKVRDAGDKASAAIRASTFIGAKLKELGDEAVNVMSPSFSLKIDAGFCNTDVENIDKGLRNRINGKGSWGKIPYSDQDYALVVHSLIYVTELLTADHQEIALDAAFLLEHWLGWGNHVCARLLAFAVLLHRTNLEFYMRPLSDEANRAIRLRARRMEKEVKSERDKGVPLLRAWLDCRDREQQTLSSAA